MSVSLDYFERTGLHFRVGLVVADEPAIADTDQERLEEAARELTGLTSSPWDFNITSADTVEISFEEALEL